MDSGTLHGKHSTTGCFDCVFPVERRAQPSAKGEDALPLELSAIGVSVSDGHDSNLQVDEDAKELAGIRQQGSRAKSIQDKLLRCCCRRSRGHLHAGTKQSSWDNSGGNYMAGTLDRQAPHLSKRLPLGAGGWRSQEVLSQEHDELRMQALSVYASRYPRAQLTAFQIDWLTPETLRNFADPIQPEKLAAALHVRGRRESALTKQDIWLNGSLRVVGHDLEGTSILSWESVTMRKSFSHYMDHAELLIHIALDMNAPGAHGWIHITDYYGWSPLLFLNPAPMAKFASWVEGQFRRRLKLAIFVDMPYGADKMLKFMISFLKPATRAKIWIGTLDEALLLLRERCSEDTARRIESYMRNRREDRSAKQHWHPVIDLPWFRQRLKDLRFDGEEKTVLHPRDLQIFSEAIDEWRQLNWTQCTKDM